MEIVRPTLLAQLSRICYISRCRPETHMDDIASISAQSHKNNLTSGVTGLLLCDAASYLQAIEGPNYAVEETFARISSDVRHTEVILISNEEIAKREFGDWSLTCRASGTRTIDFYQAVKQDVEQVSNLSLKAIFLGFANLSR